MAHVWITLLAATGLFLGMLGLLELGYRAASHRAKGETLAGTATVEGAVFALLGLMIAFTFSGASARFDARRQLIVEETNAIGTAYLRIDLLPPEARPQLRDLFRRYLDSRLATYRALPDMDEAWKEIAQSTRLQDDIWAAALAASPQPPATTATILLVPALNAMFDIATTRTMASLMHPPLVIFITLYGLALTCAFLAGYGMAAGGHRKWAHILTFSAVLAATVYLILDLEYPRLGLITVESFDRALIDLRAKMQ